MQQEEQEFIPRLDFIEYPIELIACPFFTYKEKEVIVNILSYSNSGGCTKNNKSLAIRHRITPQKITNTISMANRLGFITNREDINFSRTEKDGSVVCITGRKMSMKIPEEWSYMGNLYDKAFFMEDDDAFDEFENIEMQLLSIPKSEITRERVKKILLTIGGN